MKERVIVIAVCALIALGSMVVLAWALITGQVREQGLDGLFLLVTCLLLSAAFSLPLVWLLPPGAIRGLLRKVRRRPQSN